MQIGRKTIQVQFDWIQNCNIARHFSRKKKRKKNTHFDIDEIWYATLTRIAMHSKAMSTKPISNNRLMLVLVFLLLNLRSFHHSLCGRYNLSTGRCYCYYRFSTEVNLISKPYKKWLKHNRNIKPHEIKKRRREIHFHWTFTQKGIVRVRHTQPHTIADTQSDHTHIVTGPWSFCSFTTLRIACDVKLLLLPLIPMWTW